MKKNGVRALISVAALLIGTEPVLANTNFGAIINLAGRQRMLTQKISKEILLASMIRALPITLRALRTPQTCSTASSMDCKTVTAT